MLGLTVAVPGLVDADGVVRVRAHTSAGATSTCAPRCSGALRDPGLRRGGGQRRQPGGAGRAPLRRRRRHRQPGLPDRRGRASAPASSPTAGCCAAAGASPGEIGHLQLDPPARSAAAAGAAAWRRRRAPRPDPARAAGHRGGRADDRLRSGDRADTALARRRRPAGRSTRWPRPAAGWARASSMLADLLDPRGRGARRRLRRAGALAAARRSEAELRARARSRRTRAAAGSWPPPWTRRGGRGRRGPGRSTGSRSGGSCLAA